MEDRVSITDPKGGLMNAKFQGHRLVFFTKQKNWSWADFRSRFISLCLEGDIKPPSDQTMYNWRNGDAEPRYGHSILLGLLLGVPVESFSGDEAA